MSPTNDIPSGRRERIARMGSAAIHVLMHEFADAALGFYVTGPVAEPLDEYGEEIAARILQRCHELLEDIRGYEAYERRRDENALVDDDIPF